MDLGDRGHQRASSDIPRDPSYALGAETGRQYVGMGGCHVEVGESPAIFRNSIYP
jgi:hypothetical protein